KLVEEPTTDQEPKSITFFTFTKNTVRSGLILGLKLIEIDRINGTLLHDLSQSLADTFAANAE
ncbi:MAG TPA: hypothetical protein PKE66_01145, partial [Pyrinomonadaceae bacterium]|nr:hypothetical protein [Pyrinomonadaceae bacterium]